MVVGKKIMRQVLQKASRDHVPVIMVYGNGEYSEGELVRGHNKKSELAGYGGWSYMFKDVEDNSTPIVKSDIFNLSYQNLDGNLEALTIEVRG
ncbi:hypothetical protein J4477_00125 [Candidatus Pacearchaeota archaeon]|nr:hypothetical protein [Candidatus Pacearchaeota archaeon]